MNFPSVMRITLKGADNETYVGTLFLRNWTTWLGETFPGGWTKDDPTKRHAASGTDPHFRRPDPTGATYYVIAVVLVYGMSIVMLIASHIKRKHAKVLEDRQINKYLQEFQVVRETSSRDSYRNLKRDITAKLKDGRCSNGGGGGSHAYRGLSKLSLLPLAAVAALPTIRENRLSVSKGGDDKRRKSSLSPRCSFSRSSIGSSKASPERKHSVLSVQSERTGLRPTATATATATGASLLLSVDADRTMKSSGSVDEGFISGTRRYDAVGPAGGRNGSRETAAAAAAASQGGNVTAARRLSFPYVHQQQQHPSTAIRSQQQQQPPKRQASKRLQRSQHIHEESMEATGERKPRTPVNNNGITVLQTTTTAAAAPPGNRSRLSPKELASRPSPEFSSSSSSSSSVGRGHERRKLSACSNQSAEGITTTTVAVALASARRGIASNLSVDNLSRVFPSGDATVPTVGTFVTAARIPVPSVVKNSANNHLLPPA